MSDSITPVIQSYTVDLASNNNFLFVLGIQGDGYGTRYVDIYLVNYGQPYVINKDAVRVVIRGTKPDGKEIFNECEIIGENIVRVEITQQISAVPGKGKYEISIMSITENRSITSFPFFIKISESAFDIGYVVSSDEFGLLLEKINQVDTLDEEVKLLIEETNQVIAHAENVTLNCESTTQDAITATNEMNSLNDTVSMAEEERNASEEERQRNTAIAIENAEQATQDAVNQLNTMRELELSIETAESDRVKAENLRQASTTTAISNAEKATEDTISAKNNADVATSAAKIAIEQVQKRIDEYDSLDILNVTQSTIDVTNEANIAIENTNISIANAEQATIDARKAIEDIQVALGIDDSQESLTTAWSSTHTHGVITQDINTKIEDSKKIFNRYCLSNIQIEKQLWQDRVIYIKNDIIKSTSIIDIYYNNQYFKYAEEFEITYSQGDGWICLTATYDPYENLVIDAIMIENYVNYDTATISGSL